MMFSDSTDPSGLLQEAFAASWQVMALNGVGKSEPFELQLIAPGERQAVLEPGMRVRAVWAGCLAILSISRHCFKFDPGLVEWNNME